MAANLEKIRKKFRKKFYLKQLQSVLGKTQICCLFESSFVHIMQIKQNYVFDNGRYIQF